MDVAVQTEAWVLLYWLMMSDFFFATVAITWQT
jgi:hypothetical protein